MKKTLALLLPLVLILALCVGIFVFTASADGDATKDYATTKADELWAASTHKTTYVKVVQWGSPDCESATIELNDGDSVELAGKGGFTAGTISLDDGVLTVDGVAYVAQDGAANCQITATGALKAVITGSDFYGQFQNTATEKDSNGYYLKDAHLLVTSDDGSMFYGKGGNSIGSQCSIIVYGNIGFSIDCGTGYDGIITRQGQDTWSNAAALGHAMILAPAVDSYVTGSGAGALIESRNGDIIFAGDATITIDYKYATGTATKYAVEISNIAKVGSAIRFFENVNLNVNTLMGGGLSNRVNNGSKDAIVFNTTGEINLVSTAMNAFGWDTAMLYANTGSIRITSGKVLAAMTQVAYTGGCGVTVSANACNGVNGGIFIEDKGELVVYSWSTVASGNNRMVGIWVNNGVVDVSGNGKLASYYGHAGNSTSNYSPLTFKTGGLFIKDNAKVLMYHLGGNAAGNGEFVQFQNDANKDAFGNNVGLHMLGGQLEVVAPKYAMVVPDRAHNTFDIQGGVLTIHSDSGNIFGCDFNNKDHSSSTTGYSYVGPLGKTESDLVTRSGINDWVYMGKDASYDPYYALDSYTELLGLKDFKQTTTLSKAADAITVPAAGNYKVTGTDVKVGDKAVRAGTVVALAYNDVVTGKDVAIAMTSDPVTPVPKEGVAEAVTVVIDGTTYTFDIFNYDEVAAGEGKVSFDPENGVLTLNNATKVSKINGCVKGVLTINVVGNNVVAGGADGANMVWNSYDDIVLTGSGKLDITGKQYLFGANADATIDGPTVNVSGNGWSQVHIGAASKNGVLTLKGNSVVSITNASSGPAIDVAGICSSLVITDNADLTINTPGTGMQVRASMVASAEFPKNSATVVISGKAKVNVLNANQALQTIIDGIADTATDYTASVTIKDEASFKSVTFGQGIVVNADYAKGYQAVLQILDKANVDIDCVKGTGQWSQGLDVRGGKNEVSADVDITTTGTVKVKTNASAWNGSFILRGGAGHDVFIKDTKMIIENVGSAYSQVNVGIYCQSKVTSFVVAGDADITINTTRDLYESASDKTNRSHGLYLASGTVMTVKDNAKISSTTTGTATNSWLAGAGAIYLNNSTLNVQDNAVITANAGGGAICAFVAQTGTLNVSGNAKMDFESTSASAILIYVATTGNISVKDSAVVELAGKSSNINVAKESGKADAVLNLDAAMKGAYADKTGVLAAKTIAAPANLKAGEPADGKVALTWDTVAGAVAYEVYVGSEKVATVDTNAAEIAVEAGNTYAVTVKAVNAAGVVSEASNKVEFTIEIQINVKEGATESVTITTADGDVVLDAKNPSALDGAASYDVTTGILTLEDAEGIKKISWTEGDLIIEVKGENTIADAEGTNLIVVPANATLTITGEGTLDISGKDLLITSDAGAIVIEDVTLNLTATAAPANAGAQPATGAINGPAITIKGDANVSIEAVGPGIRVYGNKTNGVETLALTIADSADVTIKAGISAIYASTNDLATAASNIEITTTGTVKLEAALSGWSCGTFYLAGNGGHDILIKNVRLELVANQTDLSEVCCAFYAQCQADVIVEKAVVIATVNVNSAIKSNRGQAWYLAKQSTMVTKTDAMMFLTTQGTSAGMGWSPAASALHIHESTVTMEDNSVIVANATANKTPALALQTGTLIMNDESQMFLSATDHNAINLWSNQTHSITINDDAAIKLESRSGVMGGPGTLNAEFDRQNKDTSIRDIFFAKGGEAPADMTAPTIPGEGGGEGGGEEGGDDNQGGEGGGEITPPTSDVTYAVAVILLTVAAVAAGAVVVLRKKYNA